MPLNVPVGETYTIENRQRQINFVKVSDFIFLTEPIWVIIAASFVYISLILNYASYIPWICVALAFSPFLLRLIRFGRPSQPTPFDIPMAVLLGGMITGIVVSDYFDTSLGAFQTFLAAAASYYCFVNYSRPTWLVTALLIIAALGLIIVTILGTIWFFSGIKIPNGLGITLAIIVAIAIGIIIFSKQGAQRVVSGIFVSLFLGATILFTHDALHRLVNLTSIVGRMALWENVLSTIEGSSLWTGLGLGCWPLTVNTRFGHVHNAYLELYINTGVFGLAAFICFLAVGAKLAADILYSPRDNFYYGFGTGVILAALAVLALSFLESVPFGFGFYHDGGYYYILSPIPFILAGSLVIAHRLLRERATAERTDSLNR